MKRKKHTGKKYTHYPVYCKVCKHITEHYIEQDTGNLYCMECGALLQRRAPIIKRAKEVWAKRPGHQLYVREKAPLIMNSDK